MDDGATCTIMTHFEALEGPRIERTKQHLLLDIITIALCAVICGADTWMEVEEFGHAKQSWLATFLGLPNGIPSHDTIVDPFVKTLGRGNLRWRHLLSPADWQGCVNR